MMIINYFIYNILFHGKFDVIERVNIPSYTKLTYGIFGDL